MSFHNITSFPNMIWMCLQNTGKALHEMVVCTYQQQDPVARKKFFLVGYKGSRWGKYQTKLYDNPSKSSSGFNIKWILRNILWHKKMYANHLRLYEDSLKDIVDFLLVDIFEDGFADLNIEFNNIELLIADCFTACLELVNAILESEYYTSISKIVAKLKSDIETQFLCLKFDEEVFADNFFYTKNGGLPDIESFIPQFDTEKNNGVLNTIFHPISFSSDQQVNHVVENEDEFVTSNIGVGIVFIDHIQTDPNALLINNVFSESTTDPFIFSDKEDNEHIEEDSEHIDIEETYVLV